MVRAALLQQAIKLAREWTLGPWRLAVTRCAPVAGSALVRKSSQWFSAFTSASRLLSDRSRRLLGVNQLNRPRQCFPQPAACPPGLPLPPAPVAATQRDCVVGVSGALTNHSRAGSAE